MYFNFEKLDIEKIKNNIVFIMVYDKDDELISTGSGVYINENTIYTNAHVIESGEKLEIVLNDNTKVKLNGIKSLNKDKDIAILLTEKVKGMKTLKHNKNIKTGEEVWAIGSPLGIKNAVSNGILSGIYKDNNIEEYVFQHTAPISSGSSGGALINKNGELVGINYATYIEGQNLNLAIKINNFDVEYEKTKNDKIIEISTTSFFKIKELDNTKGKEVFKNICNINLNCNSFIDKFSNFRNNENYKKIEDNIEKIIRIETLKFYDEDYEGNDWVRIYLFKKKKEDKEKDIYFKKLVEYKALETRDNYYKLNFKHYWSLSENYYFYVEYSKNIEISNIINNLNDLVRSKYE